MSAGGVIQLIAFGPQDDYLSNENDDIETNNYIDLDDNSINDNHIENNDHNYIDINDLDIENIIIEIDI